MKYGNKKVDWRIADEGVPLLTIHVGGIDSDSEQSCYHNQTTTTRHQDANTYARELPNEPL
jgi:hypothetical protein